MYLKDILQGSIILHPPPSSGVGKEFSSGMRIQEQKEKKRKKEEKKEEKKKREEGKIEEKREGKKERKKGKRKVKKGRTVNKNNIKRRRNIIILLYLLITSLGKEIQMIPSCLEEEKSTCFPQKRYKVSPFTYGEEKSDIFSFISYFPNFVLSFEGREIKESEKKYLN